MIAHTPSDAFDIVVIAASFGGLAAISKVLSTLPPDFPAAIVVVQHRDGVPDRLIDILRRRSPLPIMPAIDGGPVRPGTIYVAPAREQLLISPSRTFAIAPVTGRCSSACAADPLFASVATAYRERAIAVVLTGRLQDGAKGVQAIKGSGGRVLVQDEATSAAFAMPSAAIATGCVDFVLPPDGLASALTTLVMIRGAAALFKVRLPAWAMMGAH